ncbi:hypothetical protein CAPTEDRAFT_206024 [Capitella teleta]|uniref:Uncharacterized protein n=1 Tax=Capitella teleta TaxID=283909 RepID=R7UBP1_CAPTE|nr:hypothetical protein CAPTEDRAFT_206024 [Capitella teleta]|eukprot:ELU00687.1 hypothetical protein CAPTEDRAFT_206024 [Capitella teleta]
MDMADVMYDADDFIMGCCGFGYCSLLGSVPVGSVPAFQLRHIIKELLLQGLSVRIPSLVQFQLLTGMKMMDIFWISYDVKENPSMESSTSTVAGVGHGKGGNYVKACMANIILAMIILKFVMMDIAIAMTNYKIAMRNLEYLKYGKSVMTYSKYVMADL